MGCLGGILSAGLAALVLGAARLSASGDTVGCVPGLGHETLIVVLDVTDPLIAAQPRQVDAAVEASICRLQPRDRLAVVKLSGASPEEVAPLIDTRLPASETNRDRNRLRDQITRPIAGLLDAVEKRRDASPYSPILETLVAIASDRTLSTAGWRTHVLLVSDGLQNTAYASIYPPRVHFPPAELRPLRGMTVEMAVLRNLRDRSLQPDGVAALVNWLRAAGADVLYEPPPFMALAKLQRQVSPPAAGVARRHPFGADPKPQGQPEQRAKA